jgi:hypothetical protein
VRVALWVPPRHRRPVRPSKTGPTARAGLRRLSGAVSRWHGRGGLPEEPLCPTLLDGAPPRGRCARPGRPGRYSPGLVCPMGRTRCRGWWRTFARAAMPGTYLSVVSPGRSGPVIRSPSLTTAHMGSPSPRSSGRSPLRWICCRRSWPPKGFRRGPKKWPRAGSAFALGWAEPATTGRQGVEECAGGAVPMAARGQIGWAQALEVHALGRGVVVDAGSALEGRRGFTGR